uniref:Uncharacterized protein n=1 Tax=Odontella aurita TaxID=265563 RepID=A0A7S4ISU6_9STRA|mmetsp:Transcript_29844/g.88612  ORF Transcript_29844/g.88612 Transcript_29844/m.88612 type:complete len:413 (+) Transcript_29844:324-1562(+)
MSPSAVKSLAHFDEIAQIEIAQNITMAGEKSLSAASEAAVGGGNIHTRNVQVVHICGGSAVASSSGGLPDIGKLALDVTTPCTFGRARSESLTNTDESSSEGDDPTTTRGDSAPAPSSSTPISPDADERPDSHREDGVAAPGEAHEAPPPFPKRCDGSGGYIRALRTASLPTNEPERTPSILAAASNALRFSDGMFDVGGTTISGQEEEEEEAPAPPAKRVSFGRLSVRKYPIVLGDHPECSCGPPVTLGWTYRQFSPVGLDEYETRRATVRRRNQNEMLLPYLKRREILTRRSGHTEAEMMEATREAERVRKQRRKTVRTLRFQRVEEVAEATARGLRKLRPGRSGERGSVSPVAGGAPAAKTASSTNRRTSSSKRRTDMDSSQGGGSGEEGSLSARWHRDSIQKVHTEAA